MDQIFGAILQLSQCGWPSVTECWKNHRGLEENMNRLIDQELAALNSRKTDIESRRERELVLGETELLNEVECWLQKVTDINAEINNLDADFQNVNCLCFCRANLGGEVIKKIKEVEDLHRDGEFPNGLVISIQRHGELLPTTTLGGEKTFKRNMEEIWAYLMNAEVTKIGVYGMGGIGKTTAMEHLNNRLLQRNDKFDNVIWVTVSKDSDIVTLQDKLAWKLQLNFSDRDDETTRAAKLCAKLRTKGRFVLILDDLWEAYPLEKVGIPVPIVQNGCKLVVTTRSHAVCCFMDCKPIPIELLSKEEALQLFLDIVGYDVLSIPNLEPFVKDFVHECANLPLAVVTIAGSLKPYKDCDEWEIALEDLRTFTKGSEGVLERLRFSYDRLKDKKLQDCLLYCALFPEDFEIDRDELIQLMIVEGIIEKRESRRSQYKKGKSMLNALIRVSLLNNASKGRKEYLKMHDLIRDMAIEIMKENCGFLVKAGMRMKSIPKEQDWKEDLDKVSLMFNNISTISSSESPKCPKLSTLLLRGNPLLSIHSNFFLNLEELNILDLSESSIERLPDSISNLVNLSALLLRKCRKLRYVPSLANLIALTELNFYKSGIIEAPEGIEMLVELRYLNFKGCAIEAIPDGVLCRLLNLEYLFLNCQKTKVKGEELVSLKKLKNFEGAFCDRNSLKAYVGSLKGEGPADYILQVGSSCDRGKCWKLPLECNKGVCVGGIQTDEEWPQFLPNDVQVVAIVNSYSSRSSLCDLMSFSNAINLRWCCISKCKGIKHLLYYSSDTIYLLQHLEKLELHDVWDLQGLCRMEKGASSLLPLGTFSSLKEIRLSGCNNIKKLFMITSLPNLEVIDVRICHQLIEAVSKTTDDDGDQNEEEGITLPKLKELRLDRLPELRSFCISKKVIADSLETVYIRNCPKLKRLSLLDREPCPLPCLRWIYINPYEWEALEWRHPRAKALLRPFCLRLFTEKRSMSELFWIASRPNRIEHHLQRTSFSTRRKK